MREFLILILSIGAVHALNSTDLINSSITINETLYIEDLNITISPVIIYQNVTINQTFDPQNYSLAANESKQFFGNWTVSCASAPVYSNQFFDLNPLEQKNFFGNWTVSCLSVQCNCTTQNTTNVSCGNPVNFAENLTLDYNQTITRAWNTTMCNISIKHTAPINQTIFQNVTVNQTVIQPFSLTVDASKKPGECFQQEGNVSIKVCCEASPECKPEIQKEVVHDTLLDLGNIDKDSCDNPIYRDNSSEWICLDSLTEYCPAEIALDQGSSGCTKYAVDFALQNQSSEVNRMDSELEQKAADMAAKDAELQNATLEKQAAEARAMGCAAAVDDIIFSALLAVVVIAGIYIYFTHFYKDGRLPKIHDITRNEPATFKPKFKEGD